MLKKKSILNGPDLFKICARAVGCFIVVFVALWGDLVTASLCPRSFHFSKKKKKPSSRVFLRVDANLLR